jgi:GTPase SAR1 family protein
MASYNNDAASASQPRPLQMGAKGAYIVRLLMVGDSACGKTSLVLRFDQNVFSTKFVTTIGVDYRDKMVKVRRSLSEMYLQCVMKLRFSKFGIVLTHVRSCMTD